MGLQINTTLTSKVFGILTFPTGSVISYTTEFSPKRIKPDENSSYSVIQTVNFKLDLYNNKAGFETGENPIFGEVLEFPLTYEKVLTPSEYASLAGANAFGIVEGWLVAYLESKIGVGNIVHVNWAI